MNVFAEKAKKGKVIVKEYKPISIEEQEKILAEENDREPERAPSVTPIYYYHPDHLGTSTALTDFNGNAYQFFLNLPFGETMAQQLGSNYYNSPFKFNGKELDEETGFYYYGARYYDPKISIWLSVDPLAEKFPNFNPYNYTMQNPINLTDPTGMEPEEGGGDPVKGNVRILINLGNAGDGDESLATRMKEIKKSYPNDKIIELDVDDLGKMKNQVENSITKAKDEGYGKTVELSIWGHGGTDGPIARSETSGEYSLRKKSGLLEDANQMTLEGWGNIKWNFNSKGSVASFYGCNTEIFAEKFLNFTNVKYSGGLGGFSGGFYNHGNGEPGEANPAWLPFFYENVYMHAWDDNTGKIYANGYYGRKNDYYEIRGNGSINNEGVLTNGSVLKK